MAHFIATLGPGRFENWAVCKREGLWGITAGGRVWFRHAHQVVAGDRIFVWRGGKPNGFIAEIEALGSMRLTGKPGVHVPWKDPERFGAVIPMHVIHELATPWGDTFPSSNGKYSPRFGFNNTALQHAFVGIGSDVAGRIAEVFDSSR